MTYRSPTTTIRCERTVPFASAAAATTGYTPIVPLPTLGGIDLALRPNPFPGVTFPAGADPVVGTVIDADIGDEQSIAESLSTFSAPLATLTTIIEEADGHTLVLIDEMGTGTDPMEGAALARAILETLYGCGCRVSELWPRPCG